LVGIQFTEHLFPFLLIAVLKYIVAKVFQSDFDGVFGPMAGTSGEALQSSSLSNDLPQSESWIPSLYFTTYTLEFVVSFK
jgi:hypothetical protein